MRESVKSEEQFAALIQKRQPRAIDVSEWTDSQIKAIATQATATTQILENLLMALREESRGRAALEIMLQGAIKESTTDPLTGIANRRAFCERLNTVIEEDLRYSDRKAALIYIDLNDFKRINDTYGHQAGDSVLVAVAHYLKRHTRAHEMAARLGGDEFVVLLIDQKDNSFPTIPFNRMDRGINSLVVDYRGKALQVGASLGLVHFDRHSISMPLTAEALMDLADRQMYEIKHSRRR